MMNLRKRVDGFDEQKRQCTKKETGLEAGRSVLSEREVCGIANLSVSSSRLCPVRLTSLI
jgi:hypothetical protein